MAKQWLYGLGVLLVILYLVGAVGYGAWDIWSSDEPLFGRVLPVVLLAGLGILLLIALLDRLKARQTDPYRTIEK
jgi:hypothetical protein